MRVKPTLDGGDPRDRNTDFEISVSTPSQFVRKQSFLGISPTDGSRCCSGTLHRARTSKVSAA